MKIVMMVLFFVIGLPIGWYMAQANAAEYEKPEVTEITNITIQNFRLYRADAMAQQAALQTLTPDRGKTRVRGGFGHYDSHTTWGVTAAHRFQNDMMLDAGFAQGSQNLFSLGASVQF